MTDAADSNGGEEMTEPSSSSPTEQSFFTLKDVENSYQFSM